MVEEIGWRSLPLVLAAGFALGVVMTLHTRTTLVQFGAEALIPTLQSVSFLNEQMRTGGTFFRLPANGLSMR